MFKWFWTIFSLGAPVFTLPSPKRKKVQRASDFLAVNSLGLIPSVLKMVLLRLFFKYGVAV